MKKYKGLYWDSEINIHLYIVVFQRYLGVSMVFCQGVYTEFFLGHRLRLARSNSHLRWLVQLELTAEKASE